MDDHNTKDIFSELVKFICLNDTSEARELVRSLPCDACKSVGKVKVNNDTILSIAAVKGNAAIIKLLVEECHADIEQRAKHACATPLWHAAHETQLEAVQLLVDCGADVNAVSTRSGTSPLLEACSSKNITFTTKVDIVRCLIEAGADVSRTDRDGATCLMKATRKVEICRLLVDRGASVSVVDNQGNTALHYATQENVDSVLFLLHCGTDPSVCNSSGNDVLQMAAITGHTKILECLVAELEPGSRRRADLYALVGARFVDERLRQQALEFWKKSMVIEVDWETAGVASSPNPAYNHVTEVRDVDSLSAISDNEEALRIQAQLVRERILGPGHDFTMSGALCLSHFYKSRGSHLRTIEICKYALSAYGASMRISARWHVSVSVLEEFCAIFQQVFSSLTFVDLVEVVQSMTVIKAAASVPGDVCETRWQHVMPRKAIHLVYMLCSMTSTDTEKQTAKELLGQFVQLKTAEQETLLHLAVNSSIVCDFRFPAPIGLVISELVGCGADVNALDSARNSPLLVLLKLAPQSTQREEWSNAVDLLLKLGAHIDIRNADGETPLDCLPSSVNSFDYRKLQCLAAHVIRSHSVPYRDILPSKLVNFVDIH